MMLVGIMCTDTLVIGTRGSLSTLKWSLGREQVPVHFNYMLHSLQIDVKNELKAEDGGGGGQT